MQIERNAGRREGALIGIALELYRREKGNWPESLEQLSPRWLPVLPIDRINGGPLGYRTSEKGAVVYSFGTDTDDDQGRPPEESTRYEVGPTLTQRRRYPQRRRLAPLVNTRVALIIRIKTTLRLTHEPRPPRYAAHLLFDHYP